MKIVRVKNKSEVNYEVYWKHIPRGEYTYISNVQSLHGRQFKEGHTYFINEDIPKHEIDMALQRIPA